MDTTPEHRFLAALSDILGNETLADTDVEKVASTEEAEVEVKEEPKEMTKIAEMDIRVIMENEHFLKGLSDRIAERGQDIEEAIEVYLRG